MIDKELIKHKDEILKLRDKIKEQGRAGKRNLEKEWFRNILFLVGNQWIVWNKSSKRWEEPKDVGKWCPKPVTNKFSAAHNTLKIMLTQKEPRTIVTPATDNDDDIATARFGDTIVDVINEESGRGKAREIASSWLVSTGNAFFHSFYYTDKSLGTVFIPFQRCNGCSEVLRPDAVENGTCPMCGGTDIGEAVDQSGQQVGIAMPKGKIECEGFGPFEMFFDQEIEDWSKVTECVRSKMLSIDKIKAMFPDFEKQIVPEDNVGEQSEMYQKALAYVANTGDIVTNSGSNSEGKIENGVIDYIFVLPKGDFPQGLMATIVGSVIVELSPLAPFYSDKEGKPFIPIDHVGANRVSGRLWHKTLLDDIAKKQIDRNTLESFIMLFVYSLSGGKWVIADTANADDPNGDPNQVIRWSGAPNVPAPQLIGGVPPHAVLLQILELYDREIEELTATYDIVKGQRPVGVDTYSGMALLEEKASSRHMEMISNWEACDEAHTKKQIEIMRKHAVEPRKKTYENELGSFETKSFTKADLQGGLDIKVERGSTVKKTKAIENAEIMDLIKMQVINPMDPKVNFKILEKLGHTELASAIGEDVKDAAREWNEFADSVEANPNNPEAWVTRPRYGVDNEQIHYADAASRAKSDRFFKLPKSAQDIWIEHLSVHKGNLEREMMKQAAMQVEPQGKEVAA